MGGVDHRAVRSQRQEARHDPPRLHADVDGDGDGVSRRQHGLRAALGSRRRRNPRTRRHRRKMAQGRVLHLRRPDPFHQRLRPRLPPDGVRPQHGLQPQERRRRLQLPQLRQGDLLRQRNGDGGDIRRTGPRDQQEPGRQDSRGSRSPRRHSAELAHVATQERTQPARRVQTRPVPRQLRPEPLLEPCHQLPRLSRPVRADGTGSEEIRHR